jgi:hypothetical protein
MSASPTDEHVKTVYAHFGLALYALFQLQHHRAGNRIGVTPR